MSEDANAVRHWWRTSIIDMEPGRIAFRGHPIEQLIGNVSFGQMIWLMTKGDLPSPEQAALLECALVAGVDHGPQAPSIAAARMAATCGVGLNNVMATGVNMLGDIHGGAGEQCAELYLTIADRLDAGESMDDAVAKGMAAWRETYGKSSQASATGFTSPKTHARPGLWSWCVPLRAKVRCLVVLRISGKLSRLRLAASVGSPLP